jgi:hypothetical protein
MSKKLEPVKQKANHFVDKVKFYEHLKERYKTVTKVKEKQQKYYRMVQKAKGEDRRKSEINHKIKQLLHRIPTNEYIGECILKLCKNLIRKKGFIEFNKTHGDDMISDAVENCILYISSFSPEKSKEPFSYFTQVAHWAFVRRIEKEKREVYFKLRTLHNMDGLMDSSFQAEHDDTYDGKIMSDDWLIHTRNYVNEYEQKMEKKRNRQRKKKEKKNLVESDLFAAEKKEVVNE